MNQPETHTSPPTSHLVPTRPGHQRAPIWAPWVTQQVPPGHSLYIWRCICDSVCMLLSPFTSPSPFSKSAPLLHAWVRAKSLQSCMTLCNPIDHSPPGFWSQGILQARILEWVAMSSSRGSSRPRARTHTSCIGRQILYPLSHLGSPHLHSHPANRFLSTSRLHMHAIFVFFFPLFLTPLHPV